MKTAFRSSAFMAGKTPEAWASPTTTTKLGFNNVSSNDCFDAGNNFDTGNNRYVAKQKGLYLFSMSIYCAQDVAINYFVYYHNGNPIQSAGGGYIYNLNTLDNPSANPGDNSITGTIVFEMNAADYMEVYGYGVHDWYSGHSGFWGARIA